MSMMIGVVLPRNIKEEELNEIRRDTKLALLEVDNKYIDKQLQNDEKFFQATSHGIDSRSGIGAYDLYTKDLTSVYETTTEQNKYFLEGLMELKEGYYKDAKRWVTIINKIRKEYDVPKFGIIYFNADTTTNEIKLDIEERIIVKMKNLTVDTLMKQEKDKIVFFE